MAKKKIPKRFSLNEEQRNEFDRIVGELIDSLPEYVRQQLEEMPVLIEDEPDESVRRDLNAGQAGEPSDLCGLHTGIPLTERSFQDLSLPRPLIMLFRGPIVRLAGANSHRLRREIQITLLHEIAHHFGFGEEELEKMGYG
jgi:predicted Zn-dependent protease with MMP-like domain